ncbi:MAG: hypothetical protein Q9222_005721 [Ikaeria aurantiellina]
MPSDKDRLYVGLYARGGTAKREPGSDDTYHWALLTGPKADASMSKGMRYRKDLSTGIWEYEEREINIVKTGMLLARVVIAKITDKDRLQTAFRKVALVQGDES